MPYLAYSKTLFISELIELNVVCLSSFTGASNPRNDSASVVSVAYSKHLVHGLKDLHFLPYLAGNQRTSLYSGGSGLSIDIHFVDLELSYDVLSPLPIVLSKHFNHPHPYIEIATVISDM